jgi:hypothetical protein
LQLQDWKNIGSSHQISIHLAKQFQRRRFLEIDQSETRIACGGHVCYNRSRRNEQSRLQTWPPQAILVSDWPI